MCCIHQDRWGLLFFLFLSCGASWMLGDFLLCCFCWLNRTANQSCFSPLSLFFHFATERGRCLKCSPTETCLLQIIVQKWSKTGRNVSSEAFRTFHSGFKSNLCYFHSSLFSVRPTFDNMLVCKLWTNDQYLFRIQCCWKPCKFTTT